MISAIKNIAVKGACITPAIIPAIPTSAKFLSDTWMKLNKFKILEIKNKPARMDKAFTIVRIKKIVVLVGGTL